MSDQQNSAGHAAELQQDDSNYCKTDTSQRNREERQPLCQQDKYDISQSPSPEFSTKACEENIANKTVDKQQSKQVLQMETPTASVKKDLPSPGQISFTSVTHDTVCLSWERPEGLTGPQTYRVTCESNNKGDLRCSEVPVENLRIQDLTPGMRYVFTLATINENGEKSPSVSATRSTDVPVPEELTVQRLSTSSAQLSWTLPREMEVFPHSFLIAYSSNRETSQFISTASYSTVITGLQPDTKYRVSVSTVLQTGGKSQLTYTTFCTGVPLPGSIKFTSVTHDTVHLSWEPPEGLPGPLRYRVTWKSESKRDMHAYSNEGENSQFISTLSTVITGLQPDTEHTVSVSTVSQTEGKGVPPPGPIQTVSKTLNSVSLRWEAPEGQWTYKVTRKWGGSQCCFKVYESNVTILDMTPGEEQEVTVATLGSKGKQSTCVSAVLFTEIPPPAELKVCLDETQCKLTWQKPPGLDQVSFLLSVSKGGSAIDCVSTTSMMYTIPADSLASDTSYIITVCTILNNWQSQQIVVGIRDGEISYNPDDCQLQNSSASRGTTKHKALQPKEKRQNDQINSDKGTDIKAAHREGSGKTFFTLALGKTAKYCQVFEEWLSYRRLFKVKSEQSCDMILAVCMVVSRAGTDVEAALKAVSATKPTILVVMHHTFDHDHVVASSRRFAKREDILVVDCLFHEDEGVLRCQHNNMARESVLKWIQEHLMKKAYPEKEIRPRLQDTKSASFPVLGYK